MTIGDALKEVQVELGLTAEEMTAGVISKGTYSKVINNKTRLSSDLLLKILFSHGIDIEVFFNKTKDTYAPKNIIIEEKLSQEFGAAFNNHDLVSATDCLKKIQKQNNNPYLLQRAQIGVAFLSNTIEQLDKNLAQLIVNELNTHENWVSNLQALKLFSNSMLVLSDEKVEVLMKIFFIRLKRMNIKSETMIERYAIICSNYLHWKYDSLKQAKSQEKNKHKRNISKSIKYLTKLDKSPRFLIYKILGNYYKNIFTGDIDSARTIKHHLKELGFTSLTKNWPI